MILNENLIRTNVLRNTLIQQIVKKQSLVCQVCDLCQQMNLIAQQIVIKQNQLIFIRKRYDVGQKELQNERSYLRQELKANNIEKMSEQQILSKQIKILNQKLSFIREKRQKLAQLKSKQDRIKNEQEQLQVYDKEALSEIKCHEYNKIYSQKTLTENNQTVKQLGMLLSARKKQVQTQKKLILIVDSDIGEIERKIYCLKQQLNQKHIAEAELSSYTQKYRVEIAKFQATIEKIKTNFQNRTLKLFELVAKTEENVKCIAQNSTKMSRINQRIGQIIEQSNDLNQKIIRTRQHVIKLNTQKNQQKIINQQFKLRVRYLMRIVINC